MSLRPVMATICERQPQKEPSTMADDFEKNQTPNDDDELDPNIIEGEYHPSPNLGAPPARYGSMQPPEPVPQPFQPPPTQPIYPPSPGAPMPPPNPNPMMAAPPPG